MTEPLELYERALDEFGRRVHAVSHAQWSAATPCTDWDVRELVNHLTVEQLWVTPLLRGETVEQVGDRFAGDQLGEDPVGAWDAAAAAARGAAATPGALDRTVNLSYGDTPARAYLQQMTNDLTVHAWDLARGIGGDERIDADLVHEAYVDTLPHADMLQQTGLFGTRVQVPEDADEQTRLLALYGRKR